MEVLTEAHERSLTTVVEPDILINCQEQQVERSVSHPAAVTRQGPSTDHFDVAHTASQSFG